MYYTGMKYVCVKYYFIIILTKVIFVFRILFTDPCYICYILFVFLYFYIFEGYVHYMTSCCTFYFEKKRVIFFGPTWESCIKSKQSIRWLFTTPSFCPTHFLWSGRCNNTFFQTPRGRTQPNRASTVLVLVPWMVVWPQVVVWPRVVVWHRVV